MYALISRAFLTRRIRADAWQQPAGRIAWLDVWIDLVFKPMFVMQGADLNAVPGFTVLRVGFAPKRIGDLRGGHQIAFIRGIDKDFAAKTRPDSVRICWMRWPFIFTPRPVNDPAIGLEAQ